VKRNRLRFSVLGTGDLDPEQHDTPQGFFALAQECCLFFVAQKAKLGHWLVNLLYRPYWILAFVFLPLGRDARLFVLFDQEWIWLRVFPLNERPSDWRQYR
jgi:hypothetical protein